MIRNIKIVHTYMYFIFGLNSIYFKIICIIHTYMINAGIGFVFYIYNNITTCTNYLIYIFMHTGKQIIFLFQNYFGDKTYTCIDQYLTNFKYCTIE